MKSAIWCLVGTHIMLTRRVSMRVKFVSKDSSFLMQRLRDFLQQDLGFGPFQFKTAKSDDVIATADSLSSFVDAINTVPDASILHHSANNDFSTWLFARQEFELATILRSRKLAEFDGFAAMRKSVTDAIQKHRRASTAGTTVEFNGKNFDINRLLFARIGTGSLGGKGRGLGFARSIFDVYAVQEQFPQWKVQVPNSVIVSTSVFDDFMASSHLFGVALENDISDAEIGHRFLSARLPFNVMEDLKSYLRVQKSPIAVRSSSLFEDTFNQPFAGIYKVSCPGLCHVVAIPTPIPPHTLRIVTCWLR